MKRKKEIKVKREYQTRNKRRKKKIYKTLDFLYL